MDLGKAYDSVPLIKLWEVLNSNNINKNIINAIQELYKNSTSKVKIGKWLSQGFQISKGLRQGCSLSPTLFNIYIREAVKNWMKKCSPMGLIVGEETISTLFFADDQLVLAEDYDDIEYMTRNLMKEYDNWGLNLNIEKKTNIW